MALRIYNTLTKKKEDFEPLEAGKVRMYNCGPTVYNRQHIGNFRAFLFADVLRRWLEYSGLEVLQVMNITDVGHLTDDGDMEGEDKIEAQAREVLESKGNLGFDEEEAGETAPVVATLRSLGARMAGGQWVYFVRDNGPALAQGSSGEWDWPETAEPSGGRDRLEAARHMIERPGGKMWAQPAPAGGAALAFSLDAPE